MIVYTTVLVLWCFSKGRERSVLKAYSCRTQGWTERSFVFFTRSLRSRVVIFVKRVIANSVSKTGGFFHLSDHQQLWRFLAALIKGCCHSATDRAFVPLSFQTPPRLSTLGLSLEPQPLPLRAACSSPRALLWRKGPVSRLFPLFSFSLKTSLQSFYSEKYTHTFVIS